MIKEWEIWTPKSSRTLWRLLGLLLLCLLWVGDNSNKIGVVLILFLAIMTLSRWRFTMPAWTIIIDQIACLISIIFWPRAAFGLALSIFEAMLIGRWWLALLAFITIFTYGQVQLSLIVVFIQAIISGGTLRIWSLETNKYREEIDEQRLKLYDLEALKTELLLANAKVGRMAELSERNRIAQELHDDVGHEITAAVLAFQAFEQLWREGDPLADEIFLQAQQRLNKSVVHLRERVHNMKPVKAIGAERLQDICNGFTGCPVDFQIFGDVSKVQIYLWTILEPCLKEALTNVARHAKASKIEISLDINSHIVRMRIHNDGIYSKKTITGIGLRNISQRARAVGGNISIDLTTGFSLTCVLPNVAYEDGK